MQAANGLQRAPRSASSAMQMLPRALEVCGRRALSWQRRQPRLQLHPLAYTGTYTDGFTPLDDPPNQRVRSWDQT